MADLNVIYRIAADISGLKSGVDRAAKATEGLQSVAANIGKVLTAAFSVQALVQFGKEILDTADALTKLSAKTGITVEGLQLLEAAGADAGNTIEEMAGAVNQLQNRLAEGDNSAVGALTDLGIELENFRRLSPETQFIRISDALRQVEDPAEQVRLAMDLFGRQGATLLPTLKQGFDDLKDSVHGMSEQTVKDLDALGDAMGRLWRNTKIAGGEALAAFARGVQNPNITAFDVAAQELADSLARAGKEAQALAAIQIGPKGLTVTAPRGQDLKELERDLDNAVEAEARRRKEVEQATREQQRHNQELREYHNWLVLREFEDAAAQIKRDADALAEATRNQDLFNKILFDGNNQLETQTDLMAALERSITQVGGAVEGLAATPLEPFTQSLGSKLFAGFGDFLKTNLVGSIQRAFEGGGDVVKTIGSAIGSWFTQAGGGIEKAATKGLSRIFGKTVGEAIGSIVPAFGTLLGPLLDKVGGFFKNLFGGKEKETNKTREAFVQLHGGLDALNQKAAQAGVTLTAMLNAKTPEAYKKAIDDLTAALEFQDSAMATLDETVEKYGFTIQELGPAFAKQELHKRAQQLYQDFKVLAAAGIPVENILKKMGTSLNEFVQDAIKTGTEVPAAMKPMLQQMIDHGELLDENGVAYESLEQTGLSFSETMTQGFAKLIKTVDRLTEAIARGLGIALDNLPEDVNVDVNVNTHYNSDGQPPPPGTIPPGTIPPDVTPPPDIQGAMLSPSEFLSTSAATSQVAAGARQPSSTGVAPFVETAPVNVDLTMNIDGVFSEGDLVSTIQRRVVPIITDTWNANVAGSRTQVRDVLGVA